MSDARYEPPMGFLTLGQAQARLRVSRMTLHRIVSEGGLPTYADPRNKRVKLVKVEDVDDLLRPRPEAKGKKEAA